MKMDKEQARNVGEEILAGIREIRRGEIGRLVTYPPVTEPRDRVDPAG